MIGPVRVVGIGPAGLDRVSTRALGFLTDPAAVLVVRTLEHPAARELADLRDVVTCDDLYENAESFDDVYAAIADRVASLAANGPVTYAVPGSPVVGERAVARLTDKGVTVEIVPGESFVEAVLARVGLDPLERGLQVLDAHSMPHPLLLASPTLIAQVDTSASVDAVRDGLLTLLDADTTVTVLTDIGSPDERVDAVAVGDLRASHAGPRVSILVDVPAPGWPGLVRVNALLRQECPWDREQTHHTLAAYLLEEAHEALAAIDALPAAAPGGDVDVAGYVDLEEELGDLLVQVVFHATLAAEAGVFGVEEVAERVRRKLVARHPHVFGEVDASTPGEVMTNWEQIKREEKGRASVLDGVVAAMPALARAAEVQARAARVGFDWPDAGGPLAKVGEEAAEIAAAEGDPERVAEELGDLLFSLVNLSRHLGVDPEQSLRRATARFEDRFRHIETAGDPTGMTLEEMDRLWEEAKGSSE